MPELGLHHRDRKFGGCGRLRKGFAVKWFFGQHLRLFNIARGIFVLINKSEWGSDDHSVKLTDVTNLRKSRIFIVVLLKKKFMTILQVGPYLCDLGGVYPFLNS